MPLIKTKSKIQRIFKKGGKPHISNDSKYMLLKNPKKDEAVNIRNGRDYNHMLGKISLILILEKKLWMIVNF